MAKVARKFGLTFSNIPVINIRLEYERYGRYLESGGLLADLSREPGYLHTPYMIWLSFPEMFLTVVLQRTLSGLEAYLSYAVRVEIAKRGRITRSTSDEIELSVTGTRGGAAEGLFNAAPALVDSSLAMRRSDRGLWATTKLFYETVRNPVFHGHQLEASSIRQFPTAYRHMGEIYDWIDGWHDPEQTLPGFYEMLGRPRPGTT